MWGERRQDRLVGEEFCSLIMDSELVNLKIQSHSEKPVNFYLGLKNYNLGCTDSGNCPVFLTVG